MRKTVLFIAMSLDGYIADKNGKVDWLVGQDADAETLDTYSDFIKGIDTVIMGWNTYHQIVTELSPAEWVYGGLNSFVITHNKPSPAHDIIFTDRDPNDLIDELKRTAGLNIWICGGADVIRQLVERDNIDEYRISVIPTVLGAGVRLFGETFGEKRLRLKRTVEYNGIVELVYERIRAV